MKKILIIFSSVHGQTRKITNQLAQQLKDLGNSVVIADIKAVPAMESFDKIIIGASIRMVNIIRRYMNLFKSIKNY